MKKSGINPAMLGIAMTIGLASLAFAGDRASENREAVYRCLRGLAFRAQVYYRTPCWDGGCGSFANITLSALTNHPTNAYGSFLLSSPTATSVTLEGTGTETGNDESTPVHITVVVYADSMTFTVDN